MHKCPNSIAESLFPSVFSCYSLQFSISVWTKHHQQEETKKGTKSQKRWSFVTQWCVLLTRTGAWRLILCSRGRASTCRLMAPVPTWSSLVPPSGNPMSTNSEPPTSICTMTSAEKTLICILFSLSVCFFFFYPFPLFTPKSNPQLVGLLQLKKDSTFSASTFHSHEFCSYTWISALFCVFDLNGCIGFLYELMMGVLTFIIIIIEVLVVWFFIGWQCNFFFMLTGHRN